MFLIKKTALNQIHVEAGAKLIDFGGWQMPVQYRGIIEEHRAVREKCGLFDVSHMGEITVRGRKALSVVQKVITNNAARLEDGQILYSPMCYDDGGIVDDILVYRVSSENYLLVVNAANTEKDWEWIKEQDEEDVQLENASADYAQLALQGPASQDILSGITDIDLNKMKYYCFSTGKIAGIEAIVSRTGYTGELGYEIYIAPEKAPVIWEELMTEGEQSGLIPVGLGARDTLRLEKGMCLYGNDISSETHPFEAGLGWTVDLNKEDFIGKESLLNVKKDGYNRRLIGFKICGRGIPRHGYKIVAEGNIIGEVTSGSFSPTLEENIGMGYVHKDFSEVGTKVSIKIRKKDVEAEVVKMPFV